MNFEKKTSALLLELAFYIQSEFPKAYKCLAAKLSMLFRSLCFFLRKYVFMDQNLHLGVEVAWQALLVKLLLGEYFEVVQERVRVVILVTWTKVLLVEVVQYVSA